MDEWWNHLGGASGSQQRALLLPRLYFQHFTDGSYLAEHDDGSLAAFLIGFLSQSQPDVAYIHFVGVDPALRRKRIGEALYQRFFRDMAGRGAARAQCITSPGNTTSIAFHRAMGFAVDPGDITEGGVAVQREYDGPGLDRVTFTRRLAAE